MTGETIYATQALVLSLFGISFGGLGTLFGYVLRSRRSLKCENHGERIARVEAVLSEAVPLLRQIAQNTRRPQ